MEVVRAARRAGVDERRARQFLAAIDLVAVDDQVLATAEATGPPGLRTLDAIHLASAMSLEDALGPFITYDQRLEAAARSSGLETLVPA